MTNKFGGQWTATKLLALREYLSSYATAMKKQSFELRYIDAFAGAGDYKDNRGSVHEGSARIALRQSGFGHYTFIEKKKSFIRRLEGLRAEFPTKSIRVSHGDACSHLNELCENVDWDENRAVLFLDPFGMNVPWSTLERIRKTEAIDIWYLFPLNGLLRQMTHDPARRDESKDRSLDSLLGTKSWRHELYKEPPIADLFSPDRVTREQDPNAVSEWLTARLESLFPVCVQVAILRRGTEHSAVAGPRLFALYFLLSNPAPKAQGLARNLANGVSEKLRREGLTL